MDGKNDVVVTILPVHPTEQRLGRIRVAVEETP